MADRREIFGICISNSVIIEREARICLKKPFDSLLKSNGYLSWLRNINFGRVREVLDLFGLDKNVSDLMERFRTENVSTQQESDKNSQNDTNANNLLN